MPYQQRRSIDFTDIPWDLVTSIMRSAERGETERWADLTRRMLTDGHLGAAYETRKVVLAQAKLQVEPESDDPVDVAGAEPSGWCARARGWKRCPG